MTKIQRDAVQRTANAFDNMITGTLTITNAQALATAMTPILEVLIQNQPGQQAGTYAYVGNANAQPYLLDVGDNVTIKVNDLSRVFVAGTGTIINWIAYT